MDASNFKNWLKAPSNCLIMGIVNTTPDSFSDGGKYSTPNKAIDFAYNLLDKGADIIDIGGESSRPGADPISFEEEIKRISPLLNELVKNTNSPISIDTYKSATANYALEKGAHLINDISGMTHDKEMVNVISKYNIPIILMHMKGTPKTMQKNPSYDNVLDEICNFLAQQASFAIKEGISKKNIIVDPGIGFGKTLDDNYKIIAKLKQIRKLGYPVLVGPSRKSFIGKTLDVDENNRIEGTIVSNVIALERGCKIFRVHDIVETKRALIIANKIFNSNTLNT